MRPLLLLIATLLAGLASAQTKNAKMVNQTFSGDTVRSAIDGITRELALKHPGFYRYTSKEDFTNYIDSVKSTINDSLTTLESFLKLKPVISRINCLHTGLSLSQEYADSLNQQPNLFPFQLYFTDSTAYVFKNFSTTTLIKPGDKILSINGQKIGTIIPKLLSLVPSDGYNVTMKYRALHYQFPSWYRLIDPATAFTVLVEQKNIQVTHQVKGERFNDIAEDGFLKEPQLAKHLAFNVTNDVGFLTIRSFAKSDIKRTREDFKPFINETFATLKQRKIENLVVDLRDNTGGSDEYAVYLTRHFFDKPFRYWDRIEVTEAIAKQIKGVVLKTFYRKPIQKDSTWIWRKSRHIRDFDFYETQRPAKNNFQGKVFVLINGFCMSSCSDVAAILSYNKKATFIGQETGGGYQGNTSGMMPKTSWEPFHFQLTVPLQKYSNYVDKSKNFGRGTMPDYPVNMTMDELLKGEDKELNMAISLIKGNLR